MQTLVLSLLGVLWAAMLVFLCRIARTKNRAHKALFDKRARAFIWDWSVRALSLPPGRTETVLYRADPGDESDAPLSWIRVTISDHSIRALIEYDHFADFHDVNYVTDLTDALRRQHANVSSRQAKRGARVPERWALMSIDED